MKIVEMPVETGIGPRELALRLRDGADALILDVRTPAEFKACHIAGACLMPLSDLQPAQLEGHDRIYVVCQSGSRARKAIQSLERAGLDRCVLVEGGVDGWVAAGLPVERAKTNGISILRQVQIIIGTATFAGALLALTVHPWFAAIPVLSGGGLMFAGISGYCGLAILLAKAPWNRMASCTAARCCSENGRLP